MNLDRLVQQKRDEIRHIAAKHGVQRVRVFGSVARGEAGADSDIDLLVSVGPTTSSWFPAGLVMDLEDLLGCRVEVVTERGLDAGIRDRVLAEAVEL